MSSQNQLVQGGTIQQQQILQHRHRSYVKSQERLVNILEDNALVILKKEKQRLEKQVNNRKLKIEQQQENIQKAESELRMIQQQIEFFKYECDRALENIKDSYRRLTEESVSELSRIKNPPQILQEVAFKFQMMLTSQDQQNQAPQQQQTWQGFQDFTRNYSKVKDCMYNFVPEDLKEHTLSQIMPIWKQHNSLSQKLIKLSSKGSAKIVLDFICFSVEYKLKKDIFNQSSDVTLPEVQSRLNSYQDSKDKDLKQNQDDDANIENVERYIKEIEQNSQIKERVKELSKEAVRKFNMQDHYEVLIDSTVEKDQPKTILRYKREGKRSFQNTTNGMPQVSESVNSHYLDVKDSFQSFNNPQSAFVGNINQLSHNTQSRILFNAIQAHDLSNMSASLTNQLSDRQFNQFHNLGEIGGTFDMNNPLHTTLSPQNNILQGSAQNLRPNNNSITFLSRQSIQPFQANANNIKVTANRDMMLLQGGINVGTPSSSALVSSRTNQTKSVQDLHAIYRNSNNAGSSGIPNLIISQNTNSNKDFINQFTIDPTSLPYQSAHKPNPQSFHQAQDYVTNSSQNMIQRSKLQTPDPMRGTFLSTTTGNKFSANRKEFEFSDQQQFQQSSHRDKKSNLLIRGGAHSQSQYSLLPIKKPVNEQAKVKKLRLKSQDHNQQQQQQQQYQSQYNRHSMNQYRRKESSSLDQDEIINSSSNLNEDDVDEHDASHYRNLEQVDSMVLLMTNRMIQEEMRDYNTQEKSHSAFEMMTSCRTRLKKFFCYY
ncbi:UNKNOWN [Stylonychia lemnae]|uniref:Uncharacterized protein n=1 Tax=Stylonychia lemnae TaxID=5949 RepID=A0A078A6Z0_STYLE|nr:UNKNOWN [Stylonychia lemnae]|eukprot:CDW77646.1 UNKNOWN [Stylonychia lemnae]